MIVCKECGHHNEEGDDFCGSCGAFLQWVGEKVEEEPEPAPVEEVVEAEPEPRTILDRVKTAVGIDESRPAGTSVVDDADTTAAAEEEARLAAEAEAAAARARAEADERLQREAEEAARRAEEQARREAEEAAAAEAAARARAEQEERSRREAEARAEREAAAVAAAEEEARTAADQQARERAEAEAAERRKAEDEARAEAEARRQAEEEERAKVEAEVKARAEAEERARRAAALVATPPPPPPPPVTPTRVATGATGANSAATSVGAAARPGATQPSATRPGAAKTRPAPTALKPPSRAINPGDLICGACGEGNPPSRNFCRRCGNTLAEAVVAKVSWWRRLLARRKKRVAAGERPGRTSITRGSAAGARQVRSGAFSALFFVGRIVAVLAFLGLAVSVAIPDNPLRERAEDLVGTARKTVVPQFEAVQPAGAAASSEAAGKPAGSAIDGAKNTAWAEGAPGRGEGQFLDIAFAEETAIDKVIITLGDKDRPDTFLPHPRPSRVALTFSDGTTADISLKNEAGAQTFSVSAKSAGTLRIEIVSVFAGQQTEDAQIAEVEFRRKA